MEYNRSTPKALVQIGDRPIIWHVMRIYSRHGFNRFILCLGYQGFEIKQYFLNCRFMFGDFTMTTGPASQITFHDGMEENWSITFADTGLDTNTGGRIKRVEKHIETDFFLATYADGLSNVDIGRLIQFHRQEGKTATLTAVRPISGFGVLDFDVSGQAMGFREKPQQQEWINGGFFAFERRVFSYLDDNCILEEESLARLAAEGELATFKHQGFWKCMDTFKDTRVLNDIWKRSAQPPWKRRRKPTVIGRAQRRSWLTSEGHT